MRKFIFALVLLTGVIFVITRFEELNNIRDLAAKGDWRYLLFALLLQFLWLFNVSASFKAIYHSLGLDEKISHLLLLTTAANFVNVIAPTVGLGGMAIFISEAKRRNYSTARATIASVLYVLFDYAGFFCVLILGFIVLFRRNNIAIAEVVAAGILLFVALMLAALLYAGMRSQKALEATLVWLANAANRVLHPFLKREYLSIERAREFSADGSEGLTRIRNRPGYLLLPLALSLINKAIQISILLLIFLAFKVPFSPGTLIAGFSLGYLFYIVSPTPAGIGFVEGVLTISLRSLMVPLGSAAVIALVFRSITFWIPFFGGMVAIRLVNTSKGSHPS